MSENSGRGRPDLLYDVLSDRRRRHLVARMDASNRDAFVLDSLVEVLVGQELSELSEKRQERVKIELHHRHLPKMEDAGLIEFDARNGNVQYRGTDHSDVVNNSEDSKLERNAAGSTNQ